MALQAWVWRDLSTRVECGGLSKMGAVIRYALWALMPPLLFVVAFLVGVGLEEWLDVALIPELLGRAALPVGVFLVGSAGLGSICFGVRSVWLEAPAGRSRRERERGTSG
ncbi:MAG: hypothetical protein AB7O37_19510 [Vicinamibacteria bacterium]